MKTTLIVIAAVIVSSLGGAYWAYYIKEFRIYSIECTKYTDHYETVGFFKGYRAAKEERK